MLSQPSDTVDSAPTRADWLDFSLVTHEIENKPTSAFSGCGSVIRWFQVVAFPDPLPDRLT